MNQNDNQNDDPEDPEGQDTEGQVSEVSGMDPDDSETPISPEDATAGYPKSESGDAQEGAAGPEAPQPENERDRQV